MEEGRKKTGKVDKYVLMEEGTDFRRDGGIKNV